MCALMGGGMAGGPCGHAACSDRVEMLRRTGSIFTATAASGLLLGLVLSLVACPRPIENPADPDKPITADPERGDTVEPDHPAPGDAGPTPPVNPVPDDPAPASSDRPAVDPAPPPMDPKNAPLRV
jgi:hypothetical protein